MAEMADDPHLRYVQDLIDKGKAYKLHECAGYKWVGIPPHELHTIDKSSVNPHSWPYRGKCADEEVEDLNMSKNEKESKDAYGIKDVEDALEAAEKALERVVGILEASNCSSAMKLVRNP